MPLRLELIAEQKIQEAIAAGFFDNLAGAGSPIDWKNPSLAPEDWRMTFDILEKNGYRLPWIDKRIEIEEQYLQAVEQLKHDLSNLVVDARTRFFQKVEQLNRAIIDYNLMVPVAQFQRLAYDARKSYNEIKRTLEN